MYGREENHIRPPTHRKSRFHYRIFHSQYFRAYNGLNLFTIEAGRGIVSIKLVLFFKVCSEFFSRDIYIVYISLFGQTVLSHDFFWLFFNLLHFFIAFRIIREYHFYSTTLFPCANSPKMVHRRRALNCSDDLGNVCTHPRIFVSSYVTGISRGYPLLSWGTSVTLIFSVYDIAYE